MTTDLTTFDQFAAEADRQMLLEGTPLAERPVRRRELIGRMERSAAAKAAAETAARQDAVAEQRRIAAIIKIGTDRGRPRQAARLALLTPVAPDAAAGILQGFPSDRVADARALGMPAPGAVGTFGSVAAKAERQRFGAILSHEAASERFKAAVGLATTTDMPADAVAAALAMMPPEPKADPIQSLEQRSRDAGEFGPDFSGSADQPRSGVERSREMWAKAVGSANREAGAAPADAAPARSGATGLDRESLDRLAAARGEATPPAGPVTTLG